MNRTASFLFDHLPTKMEGLHGATDSDQAAEKSNSAPQSPIPARQFFVPPGAAARPEAIPGGVSGGAGPLARGEGKRRATTHQGHGEWKKLKGGPPVREKEQHIVVDGSGFAGEQVGASDVGHGEEASEGTEGEDEQGGAGDVGQGEEASEGTEGEDEQAGAGDVGQGEDEQVSEGSEGEDEQAGEGTEGEDEQVSEGSASLTSGGWNDTATSSWKGRQDPMIKIMEDILETLKANSAVANKFMLGEFMRESIKKVMALAVDCGAAQGSIEHFMAMKLFVKAGYRDMFLTMTKEGRL
ncbi:hypothetical protein EJB05_31208, partial [Eragrostis curvula]